MDCWHVVKEFVVEGRQQCFVLAMRFRCYQSCWRHRVVAGLEVAEAVALLYLVPSEYCGFLSGDDVLVHVDRATLE